MNTILKFLVLVLITLTFYQEAKCNVTDGERANASTLNAAFMSRKVDTSTIGNLTLNTVAELRFEDAVGNDYVSLRAPTTIFATYDLILPDQQAPANYVLQNDGAGILSWIQNFNYESVIDNRLLKSKTGFPNDVIEETGIIISDSNEISLVSSISIDNVLIDGNTISSTDTNGNIELTADGIGKVKVNSVLNLDTQNINTVPILDANKDLISSSTTTTQLGFLDATSSIQTQIDSKEPSFSVLPISKGGTGSGTVLANSLVMVSTGGAVVESSTTTTQLGFLDATSSIQNQLDAKATLPIDLNSDVGATILPIANGGTGSSSQNFVDLTTAQSVAGVKTFSSDILMSGTGQIDIPSGTVAQRSGTPNAGMFRFNSDDTVFEGYDGTDWGEIGGGAGGGLDVYHIEDYESTLVTDWTASQDVVFLGNSAGLDGNLSASIIQPIAGVTTYQYIMSTSSTNDYLASPVIVLDDKQKSNDSGMTFYYTYNGDDDDIEIVVWDVTNARKLTSTLDLVKNKGSPTRYSTSFFPAANTASIQYGFHVKVGNPSKTLKWDDTELSVNPFVYKELIVTNEISLVDNVGGSSSGNIFFGGTGNGWDAGNKEYTVQYADSRLFIKAAVKFSSASNPVLAIHINNVFSKFIGTQAVGLSTVHGDINLTSKDISIGDTISIRQVAGPATLASSTDNHYLIIIEEATTEHVVTPAKSGSESYKAYARGDADGFSSTNTSTTFFLTEDGSSISDLGTISNSATLGWSFTATKDIMLDISWSAGFNVAGWFGITRNSLVLSSNVSPSTGDRLLSLDFSGVATTSETTSFSGRINAGDIIRLQTDTAIGSIHSNDGSHMVSLTARPIETQFLAAVPIPKVVYLKNKLAQGSQGGGASTSFLALNLNTIEGASEIVTLSANQFILSAGEYTLQSHSLCFDVDTAISRLQNITDAVTVNTGTGCYNPAGSEANEDIYLYTSFTITKATTFEVQQIASIAKAT